MTYAQFVICQQAWTDANAAEVEGAGSVQRPPKDFVKRELGINV